MVTNMWLYGTEDVPSIPEDVVAERLELLQHQLFLLNNEDYNLRDLEKRNAVIKAISFWENINEN